MPDTTIKSDVFKFVALRPPVSIDEKNEETNFIKDSRQVELTPIGKLTKEFEKKDGGKVAAQVRRFVETNKYYLNLPDSVEKIKLATIYNIAISKTKENYDFENLKSELGNILNSKIEVFLDKKENKELLNYIWDSYYAFFILARFEEQNLDVLNRSLRVFHLLFCINKFTTIGYNTLQNILSATPLVSSIFTKLPRPIVKSEKPKINKPTPEKTKEYTAIWNDLIKTHTAINDIKTLKFDSKIVSETKSMSVPNKITGVETQKKLTSVSNTIVANKKSFDGLNINTKEILKELHTSEDIHVPEVLGTLQERLSTLYLTSSRIKDTHFIELMPLEARFIPGFDLIVNKIDKLDGVVGSLPLHSNIRHLIKPLGIGDLKVVKQKLKKYTTGEVAHIENVLRGESKERKHRTLDRTEDIFTISNETDEETTKDTQTTDRFELKKESERTVQEEMSVQAGVTVSGSYGTVTFGAHGDFAYSTSSQESTKNSSNYAKEVIDKSVSKIQKKTKEERTTKKLHEVEEINTHGIDNKEMPDHAVGIYRWVDKYYEAQIFNYGKRMMFEFIIPEPSTFYEYAQNHKPKKDIIPPKKLPSYLTHKSITEYNYQDFIRDYNIQGITTPPALYKMVSVILSTDANVENGIALSKSTKELIIPEGYASSQLSFSMSNIYENNPQMKLSIGSNDMGWAIITDNDARRRIDFQAGSLSNISGIVPVSVNCYDINSFFVNVSINCIRTNEKYEQWQIQTFEKIMNAYKAVQMDYEQKISAQETIQGIAIHGQNPRINREIERTELKKQCIKMLMDTYLFGSFDAIKDDGINPPDFEIFDAFEEGKTVQFFEQAFEWENLVYLFYPYFWSRKAQWVNKSNTFDSDPLFTKFLQAGSSRVVMPVHPAYNDAVMYFIENDGAIWRGGETPRLNDPLFISLADELRSQTDDLANAIPEGEPWEVILPTTLVYLQKDAELPTF